MELSWLNKHNSNYVSELLRWKGMHW